MSWLGFIFNPSWLVLVPFILLAWAGCHLADHR